MKNFALKEPVFDEVFVGETIGPRRVIADERFLKQGMFALDDYSPWYMEGLPESKARIVPSNMILRDLHLMIGYHYDPARMMGLHQREQVSFHRPVILNTPMIYEGRFTEKFEKRGKGYVVYEAEAKDERSGEVLVRQVCTEIMRIPDKKLAEEHGSIDRRGGKRVAGQIPSGQPFAENAHPSLPIGTPITPLTKLAHQDQMSVFSGCDMQWVNIHTSVDRAYEGGYRDTLLAGLMQTCWISEMAANFFGEKWLLHGRMNHVYLKPVYRGDKIVCWGVVAKLEDENQTDMTLEIWTTNQDGQMTSAGWAVCAIE